MFLVSDKVIYIEYLVLILLEKYKITDPKKSI